MVGDLLMCEFHDATFKGITINQSFGLCIAFSELPCYYTTDKANVADVWMCYAQLQIDGARGLIVQFPAHDGECVSDLEIVPQSEEEVDPYNLALLRGTRWLSANLVMVGGASVKIDGGSGTLNIGDRLRFLEHTAWP